MMACASRITSATEITATSAVSLVSATTEFIRAGIATRKACGQTTWRKTWKRVDADWLADQLARLSEGAEVAE